MRTILKCIFVTITLLGAFATVCAWLQEVIPSLRIGPGRFKLCLVLTIVFIMEAQGMRAAKALVRRLYHSFAFVGGSFTATYPAWTRRTQVDVIALVAGLVAVLVLFSVYTPLDPGHEAASPETSRFLFLIDGGVYTHRDSPVRAQNQDSIGDSRNPAAPLLTGFISVATTILAGAAMAIGIACVAVVLTLFDILRRCAAELRRVPHLLYDHTDNLNDVMWYYLLCALTTLLVFSMWFYIWPELFAPYEVVVLVFIRIVLVPTFYAVILIQLAVVQTTKALSRAHRLVKGPLEDELEMLSVDLSDARNDLLNADTEKIWSHLGEYFRRAEALKDVQFKVHRIESFERVFTAGSLLGSVIVVWLLIALQAAKWDDMLLSAGPAALGLCTWLIGGWRRHKTRQSGIVSYVMPVQ
jgi:hypothetical protein